jgi:putative SOS response-associated peptidase YedK
MPGRLILVRPMAEVAAWFGWTGEVPEMPPRRNIAPGQEVLAWGSEGPCLVRWGVILVGRVNARGRPVMETIVNARSETVFDKAAYRGTGRAIVPADGWYEWTGKAGRKVAWQITLVDGGLMAFAAIHDDWVAPGGRVVRQVATLTCAPNADVAKVHDRMGCILRNDEVDRWLNAPEPEARALLRPLPEGVLEIRKAEGVDWTAG